MIYFQNVRILTPHERLPDGAVLTQQGQVEALGERSRIVCPLGAEIVDGRGGYLVPGWIDVQINGGFGWDFTSDPISIWEVGKRLPQHGVTAFLPTIITSPPGTVRAAQDVLLQGPPPGYLGAIPLGLHVEGPFLNPAKRGAHNPQYLRPPSLEWVQGWSPQTGIRLVTLAPELPGALEVVRALVGQSVTVSAGHSQASWEQAQQGFQAGVTCGTHLFNAMPPLDHRNPGLIAAILANPGVYFGMILDGIHVHPAMASLAWRAAGAGRLVLVTDAMAALGMPPGEFELSDMEVVVDATSARLKDGRLAGSILQMDQAVRNLMQFTGCSPEEAVAAASANLARLLGETGQRGQIAPGVRADLTLLSQDFQVEATWVAGELTYRRGAA